MLDLVLRLIDRVIDLVKQKKEDDRVLFTDFVAPTMADFEAVHKDYLDSFKRYRDLLQDDSKPIDENHPVFDAIIQDNLFSEGVRQKIAVAYESRADWGSLAGIVQSMIDYLTAAGEEPGVIMAIEDHALAPDSTDGPHLSQADAERLLTDRPDAVLLVAPGKSFTQVWRSEYSAKLRQISQMKIPNSEKRKAAVASLDYAVSRIQLHYGRVLAEFEKARVALLKP